MTITNINTEIIATSKDEADALEEALFEDGAETFVAKQRGKWTVFARYDQNDAAHVGRTILAHQAKGDTQ